MKKLYLLLFLFSSAFVSMAQESCETALTAVQGSNTVPETTETYYWYSYTMPPEGGKLIVSLVDVSNAIYLYANGCGTTSTNAAYRKVVEYNLQGSQEVLIRITANGGNFNFNLSVEPFVDGDLCSLAVVAEEGINHVPAVEGPYFWYSFTMPNLDDARIYFDWPFLVEAELFTGTCNDLTSKGNVLGGNGFYTTGYAAGEQFYIKMKLSGNTDFDWEINVEVPVPGDDCNAPVIAQEGINNLPVSENYAFWYRYTTPDVVDLKKLVVEAPNFSKIEFYAPDCYSSSKFSEGNTLAFTTDIKANQDIYIRFVDFEGGGFDWTLSLTDIVSGDLCDNPIAVSKGLNTAPYSPSWFQFTAPLDDTYTISSVTTTSVDTYLNVYADCASQPIATNDNFSGPQSQIEMALVAGETILINWSDNNSTIGFDWSISAASDQTISFDVLADKTYGDGDFALTATASSGLPVTYTSSNTEVAVVNGENVSIVGAGVTIITANQEGNESIAAAIPVSRELIVNKADQTINIAQIEDKTVVDEDFQLEASATSGLGLTYQVEGPVTLSGVTVSLTGQIGTVTITAVQSGNQNYNSASASITFNVNEDPCLNFEVSNTAIENVSCYGGSNGSITVTVSAGQAPFYYSLNNGAAVESNVFNNLSSGEYSITVTDVNECSASETAIVSQPDSLFIQAEVFETTSIEGNGSISLIVKGGTPNYSFNWSNGATTENISDLAVGDYTIIITDGNGCSIEETYTVGGVTANSKSLRNDLIMYPNPAKDLLILKHMNGSTAEISLYDARGKLLRTQQATGMETTMSISGLPAGLYFMQIGKSVQLHRFVKK